MNDKLTALSEATNHNILLGILKKGTTKNAIAIRAGIAPSTFLRKINDPTDFTVKELGKIAEALDKNLEDILGSAA